MLERIKQLRNTLLIELERIQNKDVTFPIETIQCNTDIEFLRGSLEKIELISKSVEEHTSAILTLTSMAQATLIDELKTHCLLYANKSVSENVKNEQKLKALEVSCDNYLHHHNGIFNSPGSPVFFGSINSLAKTSAKKQIDSLEISFI